MNKQTVLRILLAVVSVLHLLLGLLAVGAPPEALARLAQAFCGATVDVTPAVHHVARILGAFMIVMGVMAAFAFFNPAKHEGILAGIVLLLILRLAQQLIFAHEIQQTFGVSTGRLWVQSVLLLAVAAALFWARPKGEAVAKK